MPVTGKYFIKKWIPNANLVHGEGFNPGGPGGDAPGGPGGPGGSGGPGGPGGPGSPGGPGGPPPEAPDTAPSVALKDYGKPGENFFEGEMTFELESVPLKEGIDAGTLIGTAGGNPINSGYYTGSEFFKIDYPAGPGRWEIWARIDEDGNVEGMVSVGGGGGFPNFVYGKKTD